MATHLAPALHDAQAALGACHAALVQAELSLRTLRELSDHPSVVRLATALAAAQASAADAPAPPASTAELARATTALARRATTALHAHTRSTEAAAPAPVADVPRGLLVLSALLGRRLRETGRNAPTHPAADDPGLAAHDALEALVAAYRRRLPRAPGRSGTAAASVAVAVGYALAHAGLATLVPHDDDLHLRGRPASALPWPA